VTAPSEPDAAKPTSWRAFLVIGVVSLAAVLLSYSSMVGAPFFADDFSHVVGTHGEGRDAKIAASLHGSWYGFERLFLYRPLTVLSYVASGELGGFSPLTWRLPSLLLTALHAVLLAICVDALLLRAKRPGDRGSPVRTLAAALAALAYATCPSAIEPATWISARDGALTNAFGLAGIALVLRDRPRVALLPLALAFLCKETAVGFAALATLLAFATADGTSRPDRWRRGAIAALPFALLLAGYLAWRHAMFGTIGAGGGPSFAILAQEGGPAHVLRNARSFVAMVVAPGASELIGDLATPAKIVAALLFVTPFAALIRRGRAAALAGIVATAAFVAALLLGPAVLAIPSEDSLMNGRFLPGVALPLAAAYGIAAALGRPPRILLASAVLVWIALGNLHAAAWRIAADDVEAMRRMVLTAVERGEVTPPRPGAIPLMALDPPRHGLAAFALANSALGILDPPLAPLPIPFRPATRSELALARLAPELAPLLAHGIIVLPPGRPRATDSPLADFVARHLRFERFAVEAPLRLFGDAKDGAVLSAPTALAIESRGDHVIVKAPYDASSIAALRIDFARPVPHERGVLVRLSALGSRGRSEVTSHAIRRTHLLALEQELRFGASGALSHFELRLESFEAGSAGAAPVNEIKAVTALPALPSIELIAPQPGGAILGESGASLDVAFRSHVPCDRYRFNVIVEQAIVSDTLDLPRFVPGEDGTLTFRFRGGSLAGRRSTIDWRWLRARGRGVRWFVEGVVRDHEAHGGERVIARSPLRVAAAG
jgi:hypothetical protein